jgi:tetratricopeptide (TPR) repeat protein
MYRLLTITGFLLINILQCISQTTVEKLLTSGKTKHEKGAPEAAIKDYNQAIAIDNKNTDAFYLRGNAHFDLEEFQEAVNDYTNALNLNGRYKDALLTGRMLIDELEQYEELYDFTKSIDLIRDTRMTGLAGEIVI